MAAAGGPLGALGAGSREVVVVSVPPETQGSEKLEQMQTLILGRTNSCDVWGCNRRGLASHRAREKPSAGHPSPATYFQRVLVVVHRLSPLPVIKEGNTEQYCGPARARGPGRPQGHSTVTIPVPRGEAKAESGQHQPRALQGSGHPPHPHSPSLPALTQPSLAFTQQAFCNPNQPCP